MLDDNEEEIEMLLSMFSDEIKRDHANSATLVVSLPFHFVLHITLPPHGYPEALHPSFFVAEGPNVPLRTEFSARLMRAVCDSVPLGGPMLLHIFTIAQDVSTELQQEAKAKAEAEAEIKAEARGAVDLAAEKIEAVEVWAGDAISDRKSKFVAHMARVDSVEAVRAVVSHLRCQKQIAGAAHPTIYAYRFTDSAGVLHCDSDDDGETGAAGRMMFLLEQMDVNGYVVVVTRWFGGILLGPDRFKHIMEVTRNILLTIPQREREKLARREKPLLST